MKPAPVPNISRAVRKVSSAVIKAKIEAAIRARKMMVSKSFWKIRSRPLKYASVLK